MAKNKKEQKIYVVKPKIGEKYHFRFAGSPMYGPIISLNENLTKHYGHAWYWMLDDADCNQTGCRYPVSIYNISKDLKDV
jgi:hypothetical protein